MATKLELAKEINQVENEIRALKGQSPIEKSEYKLQKCADGNSKADLESWLETMKKSLVDTKVEIYHKKRIEEFYATPKGIQFKKEIEETIESKIAEWKANDAIIISRIEEVVHLHLGSHWAVSRFNSGFAEIGIVNPEQSTETNKAFFFGQTLELRYEKPYTHLGTEKFETNIGSCGSFAIDGGDILGERARFYIGAGQFFSNKTLIAEIKSQLKTSSEYYKTVSKEIQALRNQLDNPFAEPNN